MSFQDIEAGRNIPPGQLQGGTHAFAQSQSSSREDAAFQKLQHSLSLQVFNMNSNVQGILKLVDQLGTQRDSAVLRKGL